MDTISDTASWGVLVGALMPFLIAVVQQPAWSTRQRQVVALAASLVAGVGTVLASGTFDPQNWLVTLAVVVGAAQASYTLLKNPALKVEHLTSRNTATTRRTDAGEADVLGTALVGLIGLGIFAAVTIRLLLTGSGTTF